MSQTGFAFPIIAMVFSAVAAAQPQEPSNQIPVPVQTFVIIGPQNSRVEFVGTHVGDDPKPRLGGFADFRGMIGVDQEAAQINSVEMHFEIGSIWTEFDKLTSHLMTADFFDADQFPRAYFHSTSIKLAENGKILVTGELTLHGQSAEISFPADYRLDRNGLVLSSDFSIDRTIFGMDKMTEGVEKSVSIRLLVGQADRKYQAEAVQ